MQDEAYTMRSLTLFVSSHFMFNVLNVLQAEILSGNKADAVQTLSLYSGLMRKACALANQPVISLNEERTFLQSYIQLEQRRFPEANLSVHLSGFETETVLIEPFQIQPFLELAVLSARLPGNTRKIHLEFNQHENLLRIASGVPDKNTLNKLAEKCEVAKQRLHFFKHSYNQYQKDSEFVQSIGFGRPEP